MFKRSFYYFIFIFILSLSTTIYAGSLVDSIYNSLMGGVDKALEGKVNELENLTGQLDQYNNALEKVDVYDLTYNMFKQTMAEYKKYGCPVVPNDYEKMTYEEMNQWYEANKSAIETWSKSLSDSQQKALEEELQKTVISQADGVMGIATSMMGILGKLQNKLDETEPLLDDYLNKYTSVMKGLQDGSINLKDFPEYQEALNMIPSMAEKYAKGDKIGAFKDLDYITGIFSNSEAGQGLQILLENAEAIGLGNYLGKIIYKLLTYTGNNTYNFTEEQLVTVFNEYIKDFKQKSGIKTSSQYADKLKSKLNSYLGNVDNFGKNIETLGKLADSDIGFVSR